jgi:hypothetical protein
MSTSRRLAKHGPVGRRHRQTLKILFVFSPSDSHLENRAERTYDLTMAALQQYSSMPWAPRSTPASKNRGSGRSKSPSKNEALIQQLAAAHAAQQKSESALEAHRVEMSMLVTHQKREFDRSVAKLEDDMELYKQLEEQRLQDKKQEWELSSKQAKTEFSQRIAELEKELEHCQKREEAIRSVFFREFVKEKELLVEREHLDTKAAALNKKQADLGLKAESLRKERKAFENTRLLLRTSAIEEPPKVVEDEPDIPVAPFEPHPHGETNPFYYGNPNTQLSELNPNRYHWPRPVPIKATDRRIKSLREHDYYAGWLDAMRAADHRKAIALESQVKKMDTRDSVLGATTTYLRDNKDPRNPRNAGINAGLLFAYSALCKQHKYTHADVRLDARQWDLTMLKPIVREDVCGDYEFWYGVEYSVEKMKRLFKLKIERGIWKTGEDAAQIALMKTKDMKKGYEVVPGRKLPHRNVHKLARRAMGDNSAG